MVKTLSNGLLCTLGFVGEKDNEDMSWNFVYCPINSSLTSNDEVQTISKKRDLETTHGLSNSHYISKRRCPQYIRGSLFSILIVDSSLIILIVIYPILLLFFPVENLVFQKSSSCRFLWDPDSVLLLEGCTRV